MADDTGAPAEATAVAPQAAAPAEVASLVDTVPKAAAPAAPVADATEWQWAEGVKGTGERPEWFDKKYKSVEEQAKAYPELSKKFGELGAKLRGFAGAPDKYELSMPEGMAGEWEWTPDDPILSKFMDTAKKANMTQETFQELLHIYAQTLVPVDWAREKAIIDTDAAKADSRIQNFWDWAGANFDAETASTIKSALSPDASVGQIFLALEAVQGSTRQPSAAPKDDVETGALTLAQVDEMQKDPRFSSDPEYRKTVREKRRQVVGDGEYRKVVNFGKQG